MICSIGIGSNTQKISQHVWVLLGYKCQLFILAYALDIGYK